ncbi:MAG: malonic semialdehyde reductase [Candidatus Adiutrix sp.]|jgi:3-hydroxypropanoate dehydrogenase|nr:malonic semialdehyde reductase [Candidatus Adiutrix sp.]
MKTQLDQAALNQLFLEARTFNTFTAKAVDDATLKKLYDLLKWGPTAVNCQPARYVFVRGGAGRARLLPSLMPGGNVAKVESAPVTVIVAFDSQFYQHLASQWTAYDAAKPFAADAAMAGEAAFRNGSLQGAYLILAARALGLDCGPMSGFDNAKLDAEFFPDGRFKSNFLVSLGYGDESGCYPRGPRLAFDEAALIV